MQTLLIWQSTTNNVLSKLCLQTHLARRTTSTGLHASSLIRQKVNTSQLSFSLPNRAFSASAVSRAPKSNWSSTRPLFPLKCNSPSNGTFASARRYFSSSPLSAAARPNWYQGRSVTTIRASPFTRFQNAFDRRVPKTWLLYGIMAINGAVYFGWSYAENSARRFHDVGPISFMYQNFAASWSNLVRPWTLITSCFSHRDTGHIFVNLLSFYFMAPAALSILTASQFLGLYLVAGLAGNAVQLASALFNTDPRRPTFALGASGAINGVLAFYAAAFPTQKLLLMLVLPVPAWVAVGGLVCYDMYLALMQPNGTIGAAAHLGGVGAGVLYFLSLRSRGRLPRFY